MATTSHATDYVDEEQQLQSDFVELQMADTGVDISTNVNESSTAATIDNCPMGADERHRYALEKVFNNMTIWLAGCKGAELDIQSQLDKLKASEAAGESLFRRLLESLVPLLSERSIKLLTENFPHEALRVEVASRLLHSSLVSVLQGSLTLLDAVLHLERLTENKDYFNLEVAAYGYVGITLTTSGSLEIATTELIANGGMVLEKLDRSLSETFLLSHDDVRLWYCYHCVILGDCCFLLKEYEAGKQWYEASLRVAKFGLTNLESVSRTDQDSYAESSMARAQNVKWRTTVADLHSHIGRMYHNDAKYEEAAKHWYAAVGLYDDYSTEGKNAETKGDKALTCLFYSGDAAKALGIVNQLLSEALNLSMRRAELLAFKGRIEAFRGELDKSIVTLKEAKRHFEEERCLEAPTLVIINLYLVVVYSRKHDYWAALGVVEEFENIIDRHHMDTMWWFLWKAHKAHIYVDLGKLETATEILDEVQIPEDKNWKSLEAFVASVQAKLYLYENDREHECARGQYDIIEESLNEVQVRGMLFGKSKELAGLADMRRVYLDLYNWNIRDLKNRYRMCQMRIHKLRSKDADEARLARVLLEKAVILTKILTLNQEWNHQGSEVNELIDEAIQLVETRDHRFLAILKFAKTVCVKSSDPSTGEPEGHEAALIFAELQLKLKDLEPAWISMFEMEMGHVFRFMQYISLVQYQAPMKALLWAERGRMRLFMHLINKSGNNYALLNAEEARPVAQQTLSQVLEHQYSPDELPGSGSEGVASSSIDSLGKRKCKDTTPQNPLEGRTQAVKEIYDNLTGPSSQKQNVSDELWFDRDDELAQKHLLDIVAKCGHGALILEYTFWEHMEDTYIIYAISVGSEGQLVVEHWIAKMNECYSELKKFWKTKWRWGKTLQELINETRKCITTKEDNFAMEGLTILYHLLIAPARKSVKKCDRLFLAVHEDLALVPFAALYNKKRKRFLVDEKILSYIPSIRVLHSCFRRQNMFEQNMQNQLLDPPFIAGNPGSLPGWGMKELSNAGEEATLVARLLGVRPHIGPDMNKNAVKNGLSKGSVVLLATHGLEDQFYPQGALILQDRNSSASNLSESSSSELTNVNKDGDATITSDEIARLPGGIRAGLVVLSACETGKGKVTKEGLLGLGRALLQGGAPTAVLTLWEVSDSSNKVLVEGFFQQLVENDKDAAESLQLTMQQMMKVETDGKRKYSIWHWAPLVVLGSPFFRFNCIKK